MALTDRLSGCLSQAGNICPWLPGLAYSSLIPVVLHMVQPPILGDHLGSWTVMGHALSGSEGVLWCREEDSAGEHFTHFIP